MKDSYRWEFWCGMTCYGGSEQKECDCSGPKDCKMQSHPDFEPQRIIAVKRLFQMVRRAVSPEPRRTN